ncbi:GntR family transcriptional regulator [Nocardioides aurantiacus]|uniref:GntR family transcriptional regulator n=2 Tax=Nocardioides aurantiacus TaxID=86796 RepID=A0A3N2CXN0_9ACTN|nr:GntR family transcriptional regulator [Nocardioides aurantiacus]
MANRDSLACMSRHLAASRVATLLGDFDRSPAYRGLAEGLRVLITDGRVPVGVRLPSERDLTEALEVSRTTVARAYAELRDHGFLVSRQGSGSVAHLPAGRRGQDDHLLRLTEHPDGKADLTCAAPLPGPGLLAAYERAVAELPRHLAGPGYFPTGLPVLREAVADAYAARGLPTGPDQVMVVPGAQAGVAIAARALLGAGDRAVTESPTYPNAIATLAGSGARVVGVEVPRDETDTEAMTTTLRQVVPRAAYLIPDFHNPTGSLLPDEARERVAHALARTRTTAVVDESMAMLPLEGQRMPAPFASYAADAVSVGSVSKPFWGGLRIGWIRVPAARADAVFRARLTLDLGTSPLEQLVAADLLRDGEDLLAHRREQLRTSRDAALLALATHLPDWRPTRPTGGLNLWCELPEALSTALVPRAERHGVLLASGPSFAPEGGLDRFVRIPFTQPAHVLTAAIERLAPAWRETLADPYPRPRRATPGLVA